MLTTRAAVFDGEHLTVVDDVLVREPGAGEVRVRVLASGICHSDLNVLDGTSPVPPPVVLGHEAAGVVDAVGDGVDAIAAGDEVVVAAAVACGRCRACTSGRPGECTDAFAPNVAPFTWRGEPVRAYANVASFAGATVVRAEQVVAAAGLPAPEAALVGCAVSTGYGVVANVVPVRGGDTVVVFGVGGIGVNAIQTARLLDAARVVAVDVNPEKAEAARHFGADEVVIAPHTGDQRGARRARCARSPMRPSTPRSSAAAPRWRSPRPSRSPARVAPPRWSASRRRGADGVARRERAAAQPARRRQPQRHRRRPRDFPVIVDRARRGDLDLTAQVSRVWPLAEIDDAIAAVRAGHVVRAVLDHTRPDLTSEHLKVDVVCTTVNLEMFARSWRRGGRRGGRRWRRRPPGSRRPRPR